MPDAPLLVDPARIARALGEKLPLSDEKLALIEDEIEDGLVAVEDYLMRPPVPAREVTLTGLVPTPGHDVLSWRAWGATRFNEEFTVESAVEQDDRMGWTVVFKVGLDAAAMRAIARYVRAHAVEAIRLAPNASMGKRRITSMSAEGQSVSLEAPSPTAGGPGALPTLETLDRWKRPPGVYQSDREHSGPWPMVSAPVGWDPR